LWDPGDGIDLLVLSGTGFRFSTDAPELAFWTHDKGPRTYTVAQVDANDAFRSLYDRPAKAGPDWPQSVAVDGDGWLVASTSKAGLRLWDLSRGRAIAYLPIGLTHSALFLPDGSALITIAPRRVLRWPLQRDGHVLHVGPPENVLPDLQGDFGRGCLSTDGSTLVLSMNRDHALVIDLHNTSERRTIGPHAGLCSLSLSPDNRWLATGAWKGSDAKVWDFASGELTQVIPTPSHVEVGIGRDGRWLVTSETEYVLWEMETWRSVARFPRPEYLDLPGMVAFSPDGQFLAAISKAGTIDLVDLAHREMVANLECPLPLDIRALSITPDGTRILLTGREGHILHIWDLRVVRENLAAIGLDWDLPPYPPRENAVTPPPLRASISSGLSSVAAMSAATSG
jgi:WD40 repeat protein